MRHLIAVLGLLAMLVISSGPVVALAAAPCDDASMAMMAMGDDAAPCEPASKACAGPCLAASNCQTQCTSTAPFTSTDADDLASPLRAMKLHVAESDQPPGTASPVDGPPPRL